MGIPNKQIGWSQESNLLWEVSKELQRLQSILGSGSLNTFKSLTVLGTSGPASLTDGVLNIPIYTAGGGGGALGTASNGLSVAPAGNVILGGPLTGNTTITVGAFLLALTGNSPTSILRVTNSSATTGSHGIQGVSGGTNSYGISGVNTGSGVGVYAESFTGTAIRAVSQQGNIILDGTITPANNSTVLPMIRLFRDSSGAGAVNGIGSSIDFYHKVDIGNTVIANRLISRWTNTISSQRTSEISFTGYYNAGLRDLITLAGSGLVRLNQYGVSQPAGTVDVSAFALNIDALGNVLQVPIPSTDLGYLGTPFSGTITSSSGDDTPIPIASQFIAGLMSAQLFNKLNSFVDTNYVHRTGDEPIAGIKTFSSIPVAPGYSITGGGAPNRVLLSDGGTASFVEVTSGGQTEVFSWKYETNLAATDPGNGNFRGNNAVGSAITQLYVDDLTSVVIADISAMFAKVKGDWLIHIQQTNDATRYIQFNTSTVYVDNIGWWTLPVTYIQGSGFPFTNGQACTFVFVNQNAGAPPATTIFSLVDYNIPPTPGLKKSFNTFIDTVDLDVGVYKFEWLFGARNLSMVQSELSIGFLGTAAVTPNNIKFSCNALKANDVGSPTASTQSFQKGLLSSEYIITDKNNRSSAAFAIQGTIRIFVPGTLTPAISSAGLNSGTAIIEDRQFFQITKFNI